MENYPLLNLFWTMLWFFLFVLWLVLVFNVFGDIIRSHDLSGWGKAGWTLLIIILPLVGVLLYLIARGPGMAARSRQASEQQEEAFRSYVREAAGDSGRSTADEVAKLARLRETGAITPDEFEAEKAKLLQ